MSGSDAQLGGREGVIGYGGKCGRCRWVVFAATPDDVAKKLAEHALTEHGETIKWKDINRG